MNNINSLLIACVFVLMKLCANEITVGHVSISLLMWLMAVSSIAGILHDSDRLCVAHCVK